MKKFILLLSVLALAGVMGCNNDDDDTGSFVGIWVGKSVSNTDCNNATDNGTTNRSCDDTRCYRLELNADGTFSFQEGLPVRSGTWSTSGGITLCIEEDGEQVCETYGALVNSTTLTLSTTNTSTGCTVNQIFNRTIEETTDDQ